MRELYFVFPPMVVCSALTQLHLLDNLQFLKLDRYKFGTIAWRLLAEAVEDHIGISGALVEGSRRR